MRLAGSCRDRISAGPGPECSSRAPRYTTGPWKSPGTSHIAQGFANGLQELLGAP
jgi:hypothetical protein